jgi:hypothetical protein
LKIIPYKILERPIKDTEVLALILYSKNSFINKTTPREPNSFLYQKNHWHDANANSADTVGNVPVVLTDEKAPQNGQIFFMLRDTFIGINQLEPNGR